MRLGQDSRTRQVTLQSLDIMRLTSVMLAHVLLQSGCCLVIDLTALFLSGNDTLHDSGVLLEDVEAHLEDVVHLELVPEALLLVVRVDVAERLAARRVLHSHSCGLLIKVC